MKEGMTYDRRKYDHLSMEQKIDTALELLEEMSIAFPDGPAKHREAHEAWIEAKHAEAKFWNELKLDVAKKGVWGLLIIVLGLTLLGLATKVGVSLK
jgi:hypothetical protein